MRYLVFLFVLLVASCSDSPVNPLTDTMSATVRGVSWTSVVASSVTNSGVTVVSGTQSITSTDDILSITLTGVTATGEFSLGGINAAVGSYKKDSVIYTTSATSLFPSGKVTLSQFGSGRVAGTFNFTAYRNGDPSSRDSVVVVNGSFNVKQN